MADSRAHGSSGGRCERLVVQILAPRAPRKFPVVLGLRTKLSSARSTSNNNNNNNDGGQTDRQPASFPEHSWQSLELAARIHIICDIRLDEIGFGRLACGSDGRRQHFTPETRRHEALAARQSGSNRIGLPRARRRLRAPEQLCFNARRRDFASGSHEAPQGRGAKISCHG